MTRTAHAHSRARSWVLQILYAWEIAGGDRPLAEHAEKVLSRRRVSDRYIPHIRRLLDLLEKHLPEIDDTLGRVMPNWRLERLATIDRNVLRIGAAELLYADEIPGKVAISEGITLAEKYGGRESPGFVNGVLDGVYRERRAAGRGSG